MFLPVLAAILGILAFLPFNYFWLLGLVFLTPLFVFLIKEKKLWRIILGVFIFRTVFMLGTVYYALEPITWGLSILIFLGLPIVIYLIKNFWGYFNYLLILNSQFLILSLPFLWTFFDHLQARYSFLPTYIITAGNALGSSPFLGLASIAGLTTLTFFATLINSLITASILKYQKSNKFDFRFAGIILIVLFAGWQASAYALKNNLKEYNNRNNSIKTAVVSVNENFNKTDIAEIKNKLAGEKIDLLILPENILKNDLDADQYGQLMAEIANDLNVNLLAVFDTFENDKKYNSAVLFDFEGKIISVHNKSRLTFIGEYWPFGKWQPFHLKWLKKNNPKIKNYAVFNAENSYEKGDKQILSMNIGNKIIPLASLICLEIHYPNDIKEYKKIGALFIANQTSNRWIGYGLKHLLYLTNNLRKIESVWLKIPIVSAGVRDFAGIITPDGNANLINFENEGKNYGLFFGEIKY